MGGLKILIRLRGSVWSFIFMNDLVFALNHPSAVTHQSPGLPVKDPISDCDLCVTAGLQQSPSQEACPVPIPVPGPQHLPPESPQSSPTNQPGQPQLGQPGQPGQPPPQLQEPLQPFHQHNGAGPDITFPNEVGNNSPVLQSWMCSISSTHYLGPVWYSTVMKHRETTICFNRLQGRGSQSNILFYHSNYASIVF